MTRVRLTDDVLELLAEFDRAWQTGIPPLLDQFLDRAARSALEHRQVLEQLIPIDLEYRWRRTTGDNAAGPLPACPCLEDYVKCYPQLGPTTHLSVALIGEEYWVRTRRWGTPPSREDYLRRFPQQSADLRVALANIDARLAVECTRGKKTPLPGPQSCAAEVAMDRAPDTPALPLETSAALGNAVRQYRLLGAAQDDALSHEFLARFSDARALARELLHRQWLTAYQVNLLLQGRGAELLLGPYLLLDRLGEGGAGQVFKARHQKMDRVVAVKLIRKELLADAEVMGRFYREIRILSQLDHPNLVHAYDAGPVGGAHFLAMEFVEGTDLGKLVKTGGPLPVTQACSYIRQAALGLQHAHERGLVHRDVKPHNLMLSVRTGLIKVADMGLARLRREVNAEATAVLSGVQGTGTLTPENAVMLGTADYMAPEQALDFHRADIRADVYGLGCAGYFLLTGQVPFPGGTMAQKLLRHQQAVPRPVDEVRAEVPPELGKVIARMLAKRPADRYQTPAAVAAALSRFLDEPAAPTGERRRRRRFLVTAGSLLMGSLLGAGALVISRPQSPGANDRGPADPLEGLREQLRRGEVNLAEARQWLLDYRMRLPGTPDSLRATQLLMELPSPLDNLDPQKHIPDRLKHDKLPAGLVAMLLAGGESKITALAISPDGNTLAGGDESALIHLWDSTTGRERTLRGHAGMVGSLAFSPDARLLASGGDDGSVRLWDVAAAKPHDTLEQDLSNKVRALAFAPDGKTLAWGYALSPTVRLWDLELKKERRTFSKHTPGIRWIEYTPDARQVGVASYMSEVMLWDMETGAERKLPVRAHRFVFSVDGKRLAAAPLGPPGLLLQVCTLATGNVQDFTAMDTTPPLVVAFLSGGRFLTIDRNGGLAFWESNPQREPRTLPKHQAFQGATCLALDGRHLAMGWFPGGRVCVFRLEPRPQK